MAQKQEVALRKRQQIASSNKTMFIWVAGVSVVVGLVAVVAWFLVQQIMFNSKVLIEKNKAASTLQKNNEAVPALRENIRLLETNEQLNALKSQPESKALQVVLEALPADGNSLALGSSLQERLIKGVDNIKIDSFMVEPLASELSSGSTSAETSSSESLVPFKVTVKSSDVNSLKELIKKLELSIRTINVDKLNIERSGEEYSMTIEGHGFYEPPKTIELKDKVVKP